MLSPVPQNPFIWTDCHLCLGFFPGLLQMVLGVAGRVAQGQESPRVWKETLSESQREDRTWNQTDGALVNRRHKLSLQEC